jgi:cell division protein FtsN
VTQVTAGRKGHGVSVGLFAVPVNAERIRAKLAAAGLPVLEEPIESVHGTLTRVRVGPFERLDQAQAAAKRVRALGLDARVYAP